MTGGPSLTVTIPKDSPTATVQWPLTNVVGIFPGADPPARPICSVLEQLEVPW